MFSEKMQDKEKERKYIYILLSLMKFLKVNITRKIHAEKSSIYGESTRAEVCSVHTSLCTVSVVGVHTS